jgi:hypothetical protein
VESELEVSVAEADPDSVVSVPAVAAPDASSLADPSESPVELDGAHEKMRSAAATGRGRILGE